MTLSTDSNHINYQWQGTGGISNITNVWYPGNFLVTAIDQNGCLATSNMINIVYDYLPTPNLIQSTQDPCYLFTNYSGPFNYVWSYNHVPIPNWDSAWIHATNIGMYTLKLVNSLGCVSDSTSWFASCSTAGIAEIDFDNNLEIYPNPVVDNLFIKDNSGEVIKVELIDITGKKVIENSGQQIKIDRTGLAAGVYFLNLQKGQKIYHKKIMLQ